MKTEIPKITLNNLVNTIDKTILKLRRVKKGEQFSGELKNQIIDILHFIIDSNTDTYSSALYSKGIFIERESLNILHENLNEINLPIEELKEMIEKIEKIKNIEIEEINKIQSSLTQISIPIWETTQQLLHE